jgi:hypothetical protein
MYPLFFCLAVQQSCGLKVSKSFTHPAPCVVCPVLIYEFFGKDATNHNLETKKHK